MLSTTTLDEHQPKECWAFFGWVFCSCGWRSDMSDKHFEDKWREWKQHFADIILKVSP